MSNSLPADPDAWKQRAAVLHAAEIECRLLAARPPQEPAGFEALLTYAGSHWALLLSDAAQTAALRAFRRSLFATPGQHDPAEPLWRESLATSLFAVRIAAATQAPVNTVFVAGLMHRAGEALAMQALSRAELAAGAQLNRGERSRFILGAERHLLAALLANWGLPQSVVAVVSDWRSYGVAGDHGASRTALYFGRALATEFLHPEFQSPGLTDALVSATRLERAQVDALRVGGLRLSELLLALG